MQHFEMSGLWYPSDEPDNAVGGTLTFDDKGIQLVLLGAFRQGWSPETERYHLIRGVTGKSPYGSFVTLIDSFRSGQTFNMVGATSEKIRSHLVLAGDFHLPDGPVQFENLILSYTYLKDWVGKGGIEVERKRSGDTLTFVSTYTKPKDVEFPFGNGTLTLGFNFKSMESTHRSSFSEDAAFVISPLDEISAENLVHHHARTIQDLISFATDTPNAVEEITLRGEKDEQGLIPKLNLIYDPIFSLEQKKESLHSTDMLFTYADFQAHGINIFQKWLDFSRKHRAFCEVYFGYTYSPPRYADDRLAKAVSAFTLLSSNLVPRSDRTTEFLAGVERAMRVLYSEEEQAYLEPLLPTGPEVEMPIRLLELLKDNSDLMGQVIEDFPGFVRSVVDTIDSFERREEGSRPALGGGDLHYAVEKIKMLIKILVLKELGFGQDAVKSFIERNKQLNYLKMV